MSLNLGDLLKITKNEVHWNFSNLSDYMNSVLCFGVDAAD